jgi:preprotein translocase subunit YajC
MRTIAFRTAAALIVATPVALSSSVALAAAPTIMPGMTVIGPAGNPVGTVTMVKGTDLVVKTDKHEVLLPSTSFTPNNGKLLFALTRDQLNAQTEKAMAEAMAKLAVGAEVHGKSGALAGHIEAMDDSTVTVKLTSGQMVRMPRNAIAPSDNGAVLGVSAAELQAMADKSS